MMSDDLRTLAHEAYVYLYPLVTMDVTRRQAVSAPPGDKPLFGPPNEFHHLREFPPAEFRSVVRPNFDTLYSSAWLDLTAGPVALHVSDTGGRYFMVPLLDMWTDVFATLGPRTTGSGDQDYLVVGPDHEGELPAAARVLRAPTPHVWVIGRIQTNGPADYEKVRRIQDGLTLEALHPVEHPVDPAVDAVTDPLATVNGFTAVEFFTRACRALADNPPHPTDFSVLARIAPLGIVPGRDFDPDRFTDPDLAALEAGAVSARKAILSPSTPSPPPSTAGASAPRPWACTATPTSSGPPSPPSASGPTRRRTRSTPSSPPTRTANPSPGSTTTCCTSRRTACRPSTRSGR
ncbi:DUF1254 domain-containing protein [Kitasatospora saccharophila]|uniref:DUF1254 domain-containing protein n=1 Tax=Kitasatospora saccharophila TaxID=407973 RepID=UPI00363B8976